jgi:periplasmic protein TonB
LQSRSNDNSPAFIADPWVISSALHTLLAAAVLAVLLLSQQHRRSVEVEIQVLEAPRVSQQPAPINVTGAKVKQTEAPVHQVFGISPKAVTSEQGETVKAGNTVAKAPDQEVLRPGDPDVLPALPVPVDEYLVTSMPELRSDVRVPYPPACKRKGIQGAVVMDLLIDPSGTVRETTLVEGPDHELNSAALSASRGFQFTPALIKNKPVAVRIRYVYRFVLER